jgi:hypothetical protein
MTTSHSFPPEPVTLTGVVLQLRIAVSETSLDSFHEAVSQADTGRPGTGSGRIAGEIDRIERLFRQTGEDIEGLLVDPVHLTEEEMNFLFEIGEIIPSIVDSLFECSGACTRGDLSLDEITSRVSTAAMIVSRGTERFRPAA